MIPVPYPILLIMGLGAQMTTWDTDFARPWPPPNCLSFATTTGTSAVQPGSTKPVNRISSDCSGTVMPCYSMSDMAADAVGLLDALELASVHVVGASMGGMIAQTFVIEHPERTRTLTSIMSTTGNPAVGAPHPEALAILARRPRPLATRRSSKRWPCGE